MGQLLPLCEVTSEVELSAIQAELDGDGISFLVRRERMPWYDGIGEFMRGRVAVILVDEEDMGRALTVLNAIRETQKPDTELSEEDS